MGKKLGLDAAYKGLNLTTGVHKNSILNKINLSKSTSMKAYDSTKMLTNSIALGIKKPSKLTLGKKVLNIGKKALGRTPVGRAVNAVVNIGIGAIAGYGTAKKKYNKKKVDKKMGGGMTQGYGAARTSGMGLEDESLMPGTIYKANKGKMIRKGYGAARTSGMGLEDESLMPGTIYKANKGKMIKKARFGDFMNTFIADDTRSVAGKSGGADSGTAGEMRSKLGKSDVVEKKKIKNYIKKKVEQGKTVIKKTKNIAKKTAKILATPIEKFHKVAMENTKKNGPIRIYKRKYSKGGGMDMGKEEEPTQWITKKQNWITKKLPRRKYDPQKQQDPKEWIKLKEPETEWITKRSRAKNIRRERIRKRKSFLNE